MGDPVTIFSAVSLAAGAGSSILGGMGQSAAADAQAAKAERAAFAAKTNAALTDNQYLEETRKSLAAIDAIRASANTDPYSPTALAIKAENQDAYDLRRTTQVGNIRAQREQDLMDAQYYRSASDQYMAAGFLGAASKIAGPGGKGLGNWWNGAKG